MKTQGLSISKASLLALIVAASGQPAGIAPVAAQQPVVEQGQQQAPSTQATPTTQAQSTVQAAFRGGNPNPREAVNPFRRARRRLERLGIVTSGRQWRHFRKAARRDAVFYTCLCLAIEGRI